MTELTTAKSNDTIRFIGNWHESIPRILFIDPFMNSYDRNVYCVIRSFISEQGVVTNEEMKFPTYSEIMKRGNIGSSTTVAKAITVARLIGWIIQNNPSEEPGRNVTTGRFTHKQWLIVDEPMQHSEICNYDHGYVAFAKKATTHRDMQITELASKVYMKLMEDDECTQNGYPSIYARRIAAHEAIKSDSSENLKRIFFGIPITKTKESPSTRGEHGEHVQETVPCLGGKHGEHVQEAVPCLGGKHGESHQNSAKSPFSGDKYAENYCVHEVNTVVSSSNNNNKTTTTNKNTKISNQRKKLYERIGFNPNYQSIYNARFDKIPDEYQDLVILEMNERMDRDLNRNDVAYLGHLLKTTQEAVKQDDPGLLIFTPEYSALKPAKKQAKPTDPLVTLKLELQGAHADHRHWQQMQQSANEAQSKQVKVMAEMAQTKIKTLESKLSNMQA